MTARSAASPVRVVAGELSLPYGRRYVVHVITPHVVNVVESVGGWLCDRAMAGWEVTVLLTGKGEDPLPIRILGGEVVALEAADQREWYRCSPGALAIAVDRLRRGTRVEEELRVAMDCGRNDVTTADRSWAAEPDSIEQVETVEYRLSGAARAYKARALAAVGQPVEAIAAVEVVPTARTAPVPAQAGIPPSEPRRQPQ
ncbi:hypothetical protein GCM10023114_51130 [Mycolicibacterium sediminis]|uniref:Uncharacterized protein n=1 Tax=Mycolicibacterium sediminis TaxID=1286180 RepID=A0A7I7QLH7_9MYCO|nr:hypothetical protein MSEDJ_12300 [Mycolicibacterium sediminis]